jgi:hypothetical protein
LEEKNATPPVEDWATAYLRNAYGTEVAQALDKLQKSLDMFTAQPGFKNPPLIICFDEASHLCNTSAVTGATIRAAIDENTLIPPPELDSHGIAYSNFRAMRRALRYLRLARVTSRPAVAEKSLPQTRIPRVFGLFTDTNARLTNFQPRPLDDNFASARQTKLPTPGKWQFDPIHVFTSIDAHARIAKEQAVSDPEKVGEIERLLKFGRAGWYSSYTAKSQNSEFGLWGKDSIIEFAESKLMCLEDPQLLNSKFTQRNRFVSASWQS